MLRPLFLDLLSPFSLLSSANSVVIFLVVIANLDSDLTRKIIGAAIEVHRLLGPGLLESAYEECLCKELTLRGIGHERQKPVPVVYKGVKLECGYRIDILVERRIVVELKAIEQIAPIHEAVVLTYLKLSRNRVGLLINFHVPVLKEGVRRYIWKERKELTTETAEVSRENGESPDTHHA
ncbi:MAG TPA: GxxExxY protein [Terriglobales bacterium]|nr:GxxExxY protein [Terriglobales bacterium]